MLEKIDRSKMLIQKRIANVSISSSAMRNQGEPGLIPAIREFLCEQVEMEQFFQAISDKSYPKYLNKTCNKLTKKIEAKNASWGTARKALNLFFRDAVDSHSLLNLLSINRISKDEMNQLEIPLDSHVAKGLKEYKSSKLPKWKSIRALTVEDNNTFQLDALKIADGLGITRVELDLLLWRNTEDNKKAD